MWKMRGIDARSARQTASRLYIRFIMFYSCESTRIRLSNELYYSSVTQKTHSGHLIWTKSRFGCFSKKRKKFSDISQKWVKKFFLEENFEIFFLRAPTSYASLSTFHYSTRTCMFLRRSKRYIWCTTGAHAAQYCRSTDRLPTPPPKKASKWGKWGVLARAVCAKRHRDCIYGLSFFIHLKVRALGFRMSFTTAL